MRNTGERNFGRGDIGLFGWWLVRDQQREGFWDCAALTNIMRCRKGLPQPDTEFVSGLCLGFKSGKKNKLKRSQVSSWAIVLYLAVHNCHSSGRA